MDLVREIYEAFKKLKKDPKEYLKFKDRKKNGMLTESDFRHMIFDFCKLGFTEKEVATLVRRYEHPTKRSYIDYSPLIEDLEVARKQSDAAPIKSDKGKGLMYNPKTPIERLEALKYSTRCPTNIPGSKNYSMKNTVCGRQGVSKKYDTIIIKDFELILEEIMKETYLNDKLVEDHFKEFTRHNDLTYDEFKKAMAAINLVFTDNELGDLYDELRGKEKRLHYAVIDAAVESTVKRNIEECQKLILDDVYASLKSDPLLNFADVFRHFETTASNKITFIQFVSALEPKCLNVETVNLLLLAKRYCTKYDNEVYYKDLLTDLEKLSKNVDPTKEWIGDVCADIQKALVIRNDSIYKFFSHYADKSDRIEKREFQEAMRTLKLDEVYDSDRIENFYYYCDINKSGVVSCNELQKTVRQYCQKELSEFVEDIIANIAKQLNDKKMLFEEFETDVENLADPKDKAKFVRTRDLHDLMYKDLKLDISMIDEQIIFFYYKDRTNPEYLSSNKFLGKLSDKMKDLEEPAKPSLNKNFSAMQFSEEEIKKILRALAVELEAAKVDLKERFYKYDDKGLLTEHEFENCMKDLKINLTKKDVEALVNKYYNHIDKMVYAKQILEDLERYKVPNFESDKKMTKSYSTTVNRVSKYITRKKLENRVIDEMFMMDRYSEGALSFDEIKKSLHNAKVELNTTQVQDLLSEFRTDRNKKYNYVTVLVSLFGHTSHIKRNQERMKQKSIRGDRSGTQGREEEKKYAEDRFGRRKGGRTSSVSSAGGSTRSLNARDDTRSPLDRSLGRSDRDVSPRSGRRKYSKTGSEYRSDDERSLGRRDSSIRKGDRTADVGRDKGLSLTRRDSSRSIGRRSDRDINKSMDSLSPLSREQSRDKYDSRYKDSRGDLRQRPDSASKSRGDYLSRSPNDRSVPRDDRHGSGSRSRPAKEIDSITRLVGQRIKNSRYDYQRVFREVSKDDPRKLIGDIALFDALRQMKIELTPADKRALRIEIDTQAIRDERRMFSYEAFLEKAGVIKGLTKHDSLSHPLSKMTDDEIRRAEDTIKEIQRILERERKTLLQIVDIRPDDIDIPWSAMKYGIEDHLGSFGIELTSDKDKLANLRLYLCGPSSTVIEVERLLKAFGIEHRRAGNRKERDPTAGMFDTSERYEGDERIARTPESGHKKSQLAYSDQEEDYEETKKYEREKIKLDDEGKMNMAVNDLLMDLKSKQIDFEKTFVNKVGFYTDQEFIALLQKIEYVTTSADQLDYLRNAFRDDVARSKISINKMKQRFNTLDPSYLNKNAVKSESDAKQRLNSLPEKIKDFILRIDDYFQRKNMDVRQIFKEMDADGNGTVSSEEFCRVLMRKHRVYNFTLDQFQEVYKALDVNKDNSVSLGELMYFFQGAKRSLEDRKRQMSAEVKDQIKFEIDKLFEEFDTENKGYIVEEDLYKILKAAGVYIDRNACQAIIRQHDANSDGKLSKKEFEEIMTEKMTNEILEDEDAIQDLNAMFHQADINKDGYLNIDELDIMFKQHSANISYDEILSFMKEIDVDGDGRLDIDEFIALMTMDQSSFKDPKSGNTQMKMKKSSKKPAYDFVKYFKIMPNHFVESFTTRLWKKKKNLPSSVFEPKINPETLLYKDLRAELSPKDLKDPKELPLLAFQILLESAAGVPFPPKDMSPDSQGFDVVRREVRVSLYNGKTGQYIANSAVVAAIYDKSNLDKWKFNSWGAVGPNPLLFTSKDEEVVREDDVQMIFEFVLCCKMGKSFKDISCGFCSLPMREFKDSNKKKTAFQLDIKGGSPDLVIPIDQHSFSGNTGLLKKIQRGSVMSRLKVKLRYFDTISDEGKYNI